MELTFSLRATLLLTLALSCSTMPEENSYNKRRNRLILNERSRRLGGTGQASLGSEEDVVNKLLLKAKKEIVEAARTEGAPFPMNFLTSRSAMENNTAFRIIRKMPKGAVLHVHKTAMASLDWVIKNVTYRPNLYMSVNSDWQVSFRFSNSKPPSGALQGYEWELVSDVRSRHRSPAEFDRTLYRNMSLVTADPETAYPDIDSVWDVFEGFFSAIGDLLTYTPVWKDYVRQVLHEFLEDKVQYVEIRGSLPKLYELNGTVHEREWAIDNAYKPVFQEVGRRNSSFIGAKLIMSAFRGLPSDKMLSKVKAATAMYQKYPDLVVGFDVVGQEDRFTPLNELLEAFLYPSGLNPPVHLPYFFHAGETVWQESTSDENLVDALLLNTTRIGHGYALSKHPKLLKMVQQGDIAVEISPISNQVLKLVKDLRNHPAAMFMANNLPVVISSDDPTCWDALPLSHDFYVAFMMLLGEDAGLAALKQLAINSLNYSAMSAEEKTVAMNKWQKEWDKFIKEIVSTAPDCL